MRWQHGLLLLLLLSGVAHCQVFSSVTHMSQMVSLERRLVFRLGNFLNRMEHKLNYLRSFLSDYYQATAPDNQLGSSDESFTNNPTASPIDAYATIKRLTVDWNDIADQFREPDWIEVERVVMETNESFPSQSDLVDAGEALIRLQQTYRLNLTEMVRGNILGHRSSAHLSARDCLYFGQLLYSQADYANAAKWLQESLDRLQVEPEPSMPRRTVQAYLDNARSMLDEEEGRSRGHANNVLPNQVKPSPHTHAYMDPYYALCRGEKLATPLQEAKLYCAFHAPHPYYVIGPVKMEVLSIRPYIAQFYDVISQEEIDAIRSIGDPMLDRATVRDIGQNLVSTGRVSQVAWITPDTSDLVERVNRRVSLLTGLSTNYDTGDSEIIQYNSYGPGGHYEPHRDMLFDEFTEEEKQNMEETDKKSGDRIATFMFYLTDVTLGGSTVFPYAKAAVSPKKGSAAFWYNILEDGSYDGRTLHGACSVLHGTKHVANLWIRTNGQMFRRPCPAVSTKVQ
ncbi:prolyl 4-hydroxylase subunit alpha-2-like [Ornithodoros turicata]|uniref:prolyl 4-hydroxylase subunit alpha-2-like n=1 Tax=Ornithodoros turicata TaxID=34597 RepID=UPI0031389C63